jgi:hypothetical protein
MSSVPNNSPAINSDDEEQKQPKEKVIKATTHLLVIKLKEQHKELINKNKIEEAKTIEDTIKRYIPECNSIELPSKLMSLLEDMRMYRVQCTFFNMLV